MVHRNPDSRAGVSLRGVLLGQRDRRLPEPAIQYRDYARLAAGLASGGHSSTSSSSTGRNALSGASTSIELPIDRPRATTPSYRGQRSSPACWPRSSSQALDAFGREHGLTPFMVMVAALNILLARMTHRTDLVVGTVTSGRTRAEIEPLIGCFINFLPVRVTLSDDETGHDLLRQCPDHAARRQRSPGLPVPADCRGCPTGSQRQPEPAVQRRLPAAELSAERVPQRLAQRRVTPAPSADLAARSQVDGVGDAQRDRALVRIRHGPVRRRDDSGTARRLRRHAGEAGCRARDRNYAVSRFRNGSRPTNSPRPSLSPRRSPPSRSKSRWPSGPTSSTCPSGPGSRPTARSFSRCSHADSLLNTNHRGLNVLLVRIEDWQRAPVRLLPQVGPGEKERMLAGRLRQTLPNRIEIAHLNPYETSTSTRRFSLTRCI